MDYTWDANKARINHEKHGIRFADAVAVLEDPFALTIPDQHTNEDRFWADPRDYLYLSWRRYDPRHLRTGGNAA